MGRKIINDDILKDRLRQGKSYRQIGEELGVSAVAICKRIKRLGLLALPKSLENLTHKEQKFALAVAEGKSRTQAVMDVYDVSSRESAKSIQTVLMKNPEIRIAIDDLMEIKGVGREFRIEKLGEHMKSHDPVVSLKALDMGFKLSDDAGESKRHIQNTGIITTIDLTEYRGIKTFNKKDGQCTLCEKELSDTFCISCYEKYPKLVDKITRYWNGDKCAGCSDDRKCFDYCKACKEKEEGKSVNYV